MPGSTVALVCEGNRYILRRFRITVQTGRDAGLTAVADSDELSVGTAPGNNLVLTDPTVSRHHVVICAGVRGFALRDVESTNGTRINNVRVKEGFLETGDVIHIGSTTLRFDVDPGEHEEPVSIEDRWGRVLGASPAMRRIFAMLPRIASADATLLLDGETGTGKGLLSEVIHNHSPRAKGKFVVVDCSAIPATLIESELFGHEKGSFTGAHAAKAGVFEAAAGGTVFLDEIGELPVEMQPKLLRALEDRQIRRVGGTDMIRLDVRIIAATNRDLRAEVNKGTFRADLYYRLNVVRVTIPPLRERREDIPMLVAHFYEQFTRGGDRPPASLVSLLAMHEWPGNVRELRSAVERAVLLGELWKDGAQPQSSPQPARATPVDDDLGSPDEPFRVVKERAVSRWEYRYITDLLRRNGGNVSGSARAARMDRNYLRELIRYHGIQAKEDR